jgi:hypothetical protein
MKHSHLQAVSQGMPILTANFRATCLLLLWGLLLDVVMESC